ncbi:hypothetical protein TNCV_2097951 [Trichonephila clavipes]|nr:hypothetical protein TNCV_2097951 [Trichonephila clavipes]
MLLFVGRITPFLCTRAHLNIADSCHLTSPWQPITVRKPNGWTTCELETHKRVYPSLHDSKRSAEWPDANDPPKVQWPSEKRQTGRSATPARISNRLINQKPTNTLELLYFPFKSYHESEKKGDRCKWPIIINPNGQEED